jgi:hypothetical protein
MDIREYWKKQMNNNGGHRNRNRRRNHNNTFDNPRDNKDHHDNQEIINQLKILNENIMVLMNNKNPCVISKQYKNQKKVCKKCGKEKDISEFNMLRQKRVNKNGEIVIYEYKQSRCKACTNDTSTVRE